MNKVFLGGAAVVGMTFSAISQSAETTFNGYASFVGGLVVSETELPNGENSVYVADPGYAGTQVNLNQDAVYDSDLSFAPDSNYGLQIKSDLSDGLTVTALLTGRGATDFNTEIEAMYLTYDLTTSTALQIGRQRLPLYYYSDFFDVGYAYHWIRPPVDLYTNALINYDGASLTHKGSFLFSSYKLRVYAGSSTNETSRFGSLASDSFVGINSEFSTDWLRLNASVLHGDFYTVGTPTDQDNSQSVTFGSVSTNITLGDFFALAELTYSGSSEEGAALALPSLPGQDLRVVDSTGFMSSIGYQLYDFTPHLSYSKSLNSIELNPALPEQDNGRSSVTAGIRWDFHPSSSFKVEFTSTTDESSDLIIASSGKQLETDLVSFGYDVIF